MCKRDGCDYKSEAVACTTEKEENKATACGQKNKCDVCGVEYGEALAHTWTQSTDYVKTAATCTTKAVYYMVCSTCTKSANELGEEDNTWTGKALGHDMQDYTYDISGWKFVPDTLDVSAIKEPTCCADGMQISYCSRCSEYTTKIKAKDATAHIWETAEDSEDGLKWVKQGGDCIVGVTYTNKCIVVGCTEVQTKKETGGHQWGITHYEYPTCTEEGYIQETCSVCSFQKDRFYDKNMHEKLGDKYENAELAPLGHDVKESTEVAGTCISSGYTVGICDRCGNEAIEETDVYGDHTWKDVAAVEATCEKDGYSAHKLCKICGETEGKTTEAKTGHNDKDGDGKCDDCNRVPTENGKSCGCICHKTSGIMKIFYKILNFFWKLFKISKSCDCGNVHW